MRIQRTLFLSAILSIAALLSSGPAAQTSGEKETFTAVAIVNDQFSSGAGNVLIQITRWSTDAERTRLVNTLLQRDRTICSRSCATRGRSAPYARLTRLATTSTTRSKRAQRKAAGES